MPRDNAKCRKWEQERRIRFKQKFSELAKVLPSYDPLKQLCHINILEEAKKVIEELQEDLKSVLSEDKDNVKSVKDEIIQKLQKRIKKLLARNEELNNLLKNSSKPVGRVKRFKISPELEKKLQQQEMEKENSFKWLQTKKKKKIIANNTSVATKHQNNKKNSKPKNQNNNASSNCLLFIPPNNTVTHNITPALNQPFYLIANPPPTKNIKQPNIDLGLQQTSLINRNISCINPPAPTLGPGTIVFSNGSILPVLPQSPMLIQQPRTIISVQKNTFGITLPTVTTPKIITNAKKQSTKITAPKKPNKTTNLENGQRKPQLISPLKKCVTNTTNINKVPIPAVGANYTPVLNSAPILNREFVKINKSEKVQKLSRCALVRIHKKNATYKKNVNDAETVTKKRKIDTHSSEETSEVNGTNSTVDVATTTSENATNTSKANEVKESEKAVSKNLNVVQVDKEQNDLKPTNPEDITNADVKSQETANQQTRENCISSQNNTTDVLSTTTDNKTIDDDLKSIEINLSHSELSNEIFATLEVPSGCQNPDSTSPTAAFLLSFPLVSTFRGNDVSDEPNGEGQNDPQELNIQNAIESKTTQNDSDLSIDPLPILSSKNISGPSPSTIESYSDKTKTNINNTIIENKEAKNSITKNNIDLQKNINTEGNVFVKKHSSSKKICHSENKQDQCNSKKTTDLSLTVQKTADTIVTSKVGEITKEKTILILDHIIVSKEPSKSDSKNEISTLSESKVNVNINQPVFKKTEQQGNILIENKVNNKAEDKNVINELPQHDPNKQNTFWNLNSLMGISQFDKGERNTAEKLTSISNQFDTSNNSNEKESVSKSTISQEVHIQQKIDYFPCKPNSLPGKEKQNYDKNDANQCAISSHTDKSPMILWHSELNSHKNIENIPESTSEISDQKWNSKLTVSNDSNKTQVLHKSHVKQTDFAINENVLSGKDNSNCQKLNQCVQKQSYTVENVINNQFGTSTQSQNQQNNIFWNSDIILNSNTQKLSANISDNKLHTSKLAEIKDNSKNPTILNESLNKQMYHFVESLGSLECFKEGQGEQKQKKAMENVINSCIQTGLSSISSKEENTLLWNPEIILNQNNMSLPKQDKNLDTSSSIETKEQNKNQAPELLRGKQYALFMEQNSATATSNYKCFSENVYEPNHHKTMETVLDKVIHSGRSSHIDKAQNTLLWNPELSLQTSNQKLPSTIKPAQNLWTSKSAPTTDPNKNQNLNHSQEKSNLKSSETNSYPNNIQYGQHQNSAQNIEYNRTDISSKSDKGNILLWNTELNLNTHNKQLPALTSDHNLWNMKSVASIETNKNQKLHQHIRPQETFHNLEMVPEIKFQSLLGVDKQQNILISSKSEAEINLQSNITRDTMLWNLDLNTALDTSEIQVINDHNKGHNYNITNIKPAGNTDRNYKFNEKEPCLLYPQPSTENIGLLESEKAKSQEHPHSESMQSSYIWNPDSIISNFGNKKQVDQTKTENILWNRVESADPLKNGNISKKEVSTFWNPELHKNLVNVSEDSQNQTNHKQEIYLWNSKSIVPSVSGNHISNCVVQNTDNNLWKSESRSSATSKGQALIQPCQPQNTNLWHLETVATTDTTKKATAVPNDEKQATKSQKNQNTPYSHKPQNTVCWKLSSSADIEACKAQNKKEDMSLINPQSISAPVSAQNKLALQSCAKESQLSWNPESLLGFDFPNKQSSTSWNPQLGDSKNNLSTSQSTKKSGNALWNPESIVVTEPPDKKNASQLDKKQGGHLWNPESIVAGDMYKNQISTSIANSEKLCKTFWYPDSSIAPDHYKAPNIHTCSRYNAQPTSQPPTQGVSNAHYTSACAKHKDAPNSGNLVFQNVSNNNGNLWTPSHYSSSTEIQVFNNSKFNEYNGTYTWATDLNKTNSQRKTNENTVNNVSNSGNVKLNIDQHSQYNTPNCVQNSALWPVNQFEKSTLALDQFKKPKETSGNIIKSSGNAGNVQNDFNLHYNLIPGSNNTHNSNFSNNDTKKNIWNLHQVQEVNNLKPNLLQNSKTAKNDVVQNVENTEKQNSLQASINIDNFSQTSIQNQHMWNVKDVQRIGHDQLYSQPEKSNQSKKMQNSIEKPGATGMEFSLEETLTTHEKRDVSYNICKNKNTPSNNNPTETKSIIFDHNAQIENKQTFNTSKTENTNCNIFKEEVVCGFDKTNMSNSNNFGLYMEPTMRNSKTDQSSTSSYNTYLEKNKSSSTNPNKMVHTSSSVNSQQNVSQVSIDNIAKDSEQRSQYYFPNIYPTVSANISFQNETPKNYSTSIYTNVNKDYSTPLYTSSANFNHNVTDTTFNENYYKNKCELKYAAANYNSIQDPSRSSSKFYSTTNNSSKKHSSNKGKNLTSTQPVNWMTTPENKMQTVDCFLPSCSTQSYSLNSCVVPTTNANSTVHLDDKKHIDSITDDKQFYWSSSKYTNFVEPTANFVTPTLPTLVGDLALGNSAFGEQKPNKEVKKKSTSENQVSFLSVSQLVDQNKAETNPAKMASRRNSGGRSKSNNSIKTKRSTKKDTAVEKGAHNKSVSNIHCVDNTAAQNEQFCDKNRNSSKNVCSSYSAEALIGNPICSSGSKKIPETPGKLQGNNILSDITYFPSVDENYIISNQNFQTPNFSHASFQNASYNSNNFIYTTASAIASTYLPNTFEPTLPDYTTDNLNLGVNVNKEKNPTNKHVKSSKEDKTHCTKKNKRKVAFDGGSTGFEYPFIPVPGSNNSPILPDDFHVPTNILSSTAAPYSCKNNIFQKVAGDFNPNTLLPLGLPRNTIPQPEISPINSASTFTNFNLSSIFPEINKGASGNIFQ